jgi:very-short-patch-repair endonuclease
MTKAEACLWKYVLKARQVQGYAFTRQRPVLNYIADFMCKELKLIIEVDGSIHQLNDVKENDRIRQAELERSGFMVIRFNNDEVLKEIELVRERINKTVAAIQECNSTNSSPDSDY